MVQITKANFIGSAGPAGGPTPPIVGDPQAVQNANALSAELKQISAQIGEIQEASDEMAMQSALSEAQFTFTQQANDRANKMYNDDGTPAYGSMDTDLQAFAKQNKERVMERVPLGKRDKFNLLYDDIANKKRIKGMAVAKAQQIEIATGEFYESLNTLVKTSVLSGNRENLADNLLKINTLIDTGVSQQLIDPKTGAKAKASMKEDILVSIYKQQVNEDPMAALNMLKQGAEALDITPDNHIALTKEATSLHKQQLEVEKIGLNAKITDFTTVSDTMSSAFETVLQNTPTMDVNTNKTILPAEKNRYIEDLQAHYDDQRIPDEDIAAMQQVDPQRAMQMRQANQKMFTQFRKTVEKIEKDYNTHNSSVFDRQNRIVKAEQDMGNNVRLTPEEASKYANDTQMSRLPMDQMVTKALQLRQPVQQTADRFADTIRSAGVLISTKEGAAQLQSALEGFDTLDKQGLLSKMPEGELKRWRQLSKDVLLSGNLQASVDRLEKDRLVVDPTMRSQRKKYWAGNDVNKTPRFIGIRDDVLNPSWWRSLRTDAKFQFRNKDVDPMLKEHVNSVIMKHAEYYDESEREALVEAVRKDIMSNVGVSPIPDENGNNRLMFMPPQHEVGAQTTETEETMVEFFREDLKNDAAAAGVAMDNIYLRASTIRSSDPTQPTTYDIYGKNSNGNQVFLGKYRFSKSDFREFQKAKARHRKKQFDKGQAKIEEGRKWISDNIDTDNLTE